MDTSLEKPKSLIEEYVLFFGALMEDLQEYDPTRKGLVDLEERPRPKFTTLAFHNGKVSWAHCPKGRNQISEGQLEQFKANFLQRLGQLQELVLKGKWSFLGSLLHQNIAGGGFFCETCQRRYSMKILPIVSETPRLLEKLRTSKLPIE